MNHYVSYVETNKDHSTQVKCTGNILVT